MTSLRRQELMGGRGGSSGASKGVGSNLPALEGTEKQTAWANDIRDNLVSDYSDFINSDKIYFNELRRTTADEVFQDLYENGIVNSQKNYPATTKYQEMRNKAVAENPGKKAVEIDEITDSLYVDKVKAKADKGYKKYKEQYQKTKEAGTPDKSLMQKAKEARARVYKDEMKKLINDSLKNATKASDWIDTYKSTQYSKKK